MTFFNKKTEVMSVELTPYGRYLYSIGKLNPKYYEFVDNDVVYRLSGSGEAQEDSHQRITSETPRLKMGRSPRQEVEYLQPISIEYQREVVEKMDQKQNCLSPLGRSSYSSDKYPNFQVTMLQGFISSSQMVHQVDLTNTHGQQSLSGSVFIPQVEVDMSFNATLKNVLDNPIPESEFFSQTFSDGRYVEISFTEPIIHLKEFNSFYEKENFEIEVFEVMQTGSLRKLKFRKELSYIVNDILIDGETSVNEEIDESMMSYSEQDSSFVDYFFSITKDELIPEEELCEAVDKLEINSNFLDEELICPDQRTERFDIYSTKVGPDDLEDC
tara:strand:- start:8834 stop:9817 length:984 start_codon:yes stop_codon:yes gene_type:complete